MKDDYLWDGSGEPDAETEQLEILLGQFRHREQPLKLPAESTLPAPTPIVPTTRRRFYKFAAAAALIIATLGVGISLLLRPSVITSPSIAGTATVDTAAISQPSVVPGDTSSPVDNKIIARDTDTHKTTTVSHPRPEVARRFTPITCYQVANHRGDNDQLESDREGEAAARLLMALQIAGSKLNTTKKRIHAVYQHDGTQS